MKTDLHEKKIEKKNEFLKKLNEKSIESDRPLLSWVRKAFE